MVAAETCGPLVTRQEHVLCIQRHSVNSHGGNRSLLNGLDQPVAILRTTEGGANAPSLIFAGQHAAVGQEMPPAHAA